MKKKTVRDEIRVLDTPRLIAQLAFAPPDLLTKIAAELGRRRAKDASDPLESLLDSDVAEVRATVADALGKIGDDRAGQALTTLLADSTQPDFVRDTCAYALAQIVYPQALPVLIGALDDPSESVRRCVRSAVQAIVQSRDLKPEALRPSVTRGTPPNLPNEFVVAKIPPRHPSEHKSHMFGRFRYRRPQSIEKGIAGRRLIEQTSMSGSAAGKERARKLSATLNFPTLDSGLSI